MNNAIISLALIKLLIPLFSGFYSNGTPAFSWVSTISVKISVGEVIIGLSSTSSSVRIRDAKVHLIKCGWLSRQYKTFLSETAIFPVDLTSSGKYHWGENYAVQTHVKELILLLEIFLS